jgi:hypothetical protein
VCVFYIRILRSFLFASSSIFHLPVILIVKPSYLYIHCCYFSLITTAPPGYLRYHSHFTYLSAYLSLSYSLFTFFLYVNHILRSILAAIIAAIVTKYPLLCLIYHTPTHPHTYTRASTPAVGYLLSFGYISDKG